MMSRKRPLGIYIHIPFCMKKCNYCDFLSFANHSDREPYILAVCDELRYYGPRLREQYEVRSIFMGGGTPSILTEKEIVSIAEALHESFVIPQTAEWSIEANPATFNMEKARVWREIGINRVSMGVQSLDDRILRRLGRIHTAAEAAEGYRTLRAAGFENVSLDLILGLPGQAFENWMETLNEAISWDPEHVSCYSLIVEEGTPFFEDELQGKLTLPSEEEERRMYHEGTTVLMQKGYEQYEISNYAKRGYESIHNTGYWIRTPYLGVGLGAASLLEETRYSNQTNLARYIEEGASRHVQEREIVTMQDQMSEFMFLGLRMNRGIGRDEFYAAFGQQVEDVYGNAIGKTIRQGLLTRDRDRYHLTKRGFDLANLVFCEFI